MGKKYIIDLNPDCVEGEYLRIPARIAGEEQWLVTKAALTPYNAPDLEQVRTEAYEDGYKTAKIQCCIQAEKDMREVGKRHYQRGLVDAWEAARTIVKMSWEDKNKIFGKMLLHSNIFLDYTADEAIEKIRQYEQEQKEFHVGDEFENGSGKKFVVLKMNGKEIDRYIDSDGKTYLMCRKYRVMRKTGRHFPEISSVLEKMREES
jgi:hypothetical protein